MLDTQAGSSDANSRVLLVDEEIKMFSIYSKQQAHTSTSTDRQVWLTASIEHLLSRLLPQAHFPFCPVSSALLPPRSGHCHLVATFSQPCSRIFPTSNPIRNALSIANVTPNEGSF
jgi:hypothetical protein